MRLYTWRMTGLADEVRSDAMPDAAGGEVVPFRREMQLARAPSRELGE
jgi:hypothetical protein